MTRQNSLSPYVKYNAHTLEILSSVMNVDFKLSRGRLCRWVKFLVAFRSNSLQSNNTFTKILERHWVRDISIADDAKFALQIND